MSDPAICNSCGGAMKPLFTGFYCPNDCDKPAAKTKDSNKTPPHGIDYSKIRKATGRLNPTFSVGGWGFPVPPPAPPPPDDQCRDFYCGAIGKKTHSYGVINSPGIYDWFDAYECQICKKKWSVPTPKASNNPVTPVAVN